MAKHCDIQEIAEINNTGNKDIISLAGSAFFIFLISIIGYLIAYEFEFLRAWHYDFDIDLIVITPSVLIKNNLKTLPFIMVLVYFLCDIFTKNKNIGRNKQAPMSKKQKILLYVITSIPVLEILVMVWLDNKLLIILALIVLGFSYLILAYKILNKNPFLTRKIIYLIMLSIFTIITMIPLIYYSVLYEQYSYQTFKNEGKMYILISVYDHRIIGKKIIESKTTPDCYQVDEDNDSILVLDESNFEKGISFSKINVIKSCSTSSKIEKN